MEQSILTNDRIVALVVGIITILGTGFIGLVIYIWRSFVKEIHSYRADTIEQRTEFNNALNNKFKGINHYMKQTDIIQVKHEQNIDTIREHTRDIKSKIADHEVKINIHSERLAKHDTEIDNLKK